MDASRFEYLADGFLKGTLTPEEKKEFIARYRKNLDEEVEVPTSEGVLRDRMLAGIRAEMTSPSPVRKMVWGRWVAVAACVLLLAGSGWWYWHRTPVAQVVAVAADVAPGGNKAVLTLAGGRRIVLDSARVGVLTAAGGVTILKVDSGRLAYTGVAGEVGFNTLTTPRGGEYQLVLPDGTRVWLNAASSITYPTSFRGASREVTMTGEAYFEVAHDARAPFIVHAGGRSVFDLGTGFDVNAYPEEGPMRTTLVEGKVRVGEKVLSPGQQEVAGAVHAVDVQVVTAWKNGAFSLSEVDFAALMRQVSRWYDVDVVYEGKVPQRQFVGRIKKKVTLSRLVEAMREYGIGVKLQDKKLIIMP